MPMHVGGVPLLTPGGAPALDSSCCCDQPSCTVCEFDTPRTLYISVTLTIDAGEECAEGCTTDGFDDLPTWPSSATVSTLTGAVFLSTFTGDPCYDTGTVSFGATFYCIDDQFYIAPISSGPFMFILNDSCDTTVCIVRSALTGIWPNGDPDGDAHPIGYSDCNPLSLSADVPVTIHDYTTGDQCGTGTMHVTITE